MSSKKTSLPYAKEFLEKLLYQMLLIRDFEEKASQMYGLRKIGGFLHLYIGQEAVAVGSIASLDLARDYVLTAYRDHGHALVCGTSSRSLMAELYGKATGCSRGKGGSMHFFDAKNHFLGGNGIVGAHIPLAAGVALKIAYNKEGGLVLCFFGDGAIHQGSFHETLNLAKIWRLPVIFICENNQYGMGTDFRRVSSVTDFTLFGNSYGIQGRQVDGMDVLAVYEEFVRTGKHCRENLEPAFIEVKTYRYRGHSASDPAKYRTKEELDEYKKQDPILILKSKMTEAGVAGQDDFERLEARCRIEVDDAMEFAEKSPQPALETLYEDVLV
ncbi:MAG: pyruvate dehydrogenase (acetyl-transferring) E1 component subunit alpha [Chitinispirillaceae bacterium]|nr:pyruvate dehydrogenase (acetyl-transferring) E1 component subunit alpha [Chitinispirillaceae bacterium]